MTSLSQTYGTQQTDADIITPSLGKKVFIYYMKLETTQQGGASLVFPSKTGSGAAGIEQTVPILEVFSSTVGFAESNTGTLGNVDEALRLTCTPGTKVVVIYEEI